MCRLGGGLGVPLVSVCKWSPAALVCSVSQWLVPGFYGVRMYRRQIQLAGLPIGSHRLHMPATFVRNQLQFPVNESDALNHSARHSIWTFAQIRQHIRELEEGYGIRVRWKPERGTSKRCRFGVYRTCACSCLSNYVRGGFEIAQHHPVVVSKIAW